MEKLEGQVSKIRFSTDVSGSENGTSTAQIAVFELDGRSIEFRSKDSIILEDGDTCVIAGITENGLFKALSFKNKTKNIVSHSEAKVLKAFGWLFTLVGIATIPVLVGIVFTFFGIKMLKQSKLVKQAHEMILLES
ncbi:hypothetical protein [Pleionea sp. CnH1-48]|uniref:hypothetical protein n=1 Tax=Pleionea sp. CnH1-48 TaxID=2954494 RepID=UPI0020981748|nr:hypothetical protein [Pleionea sp. CnH1-48]MCO7226170.1 hypothetical protein [Pleionea sp. CnH1-48]